MAIDGKAVITQGFWYVDSTYDEWACRNISDGFLNSLPDHYVPPAIVERVYRWLHLRAYKRLRGH